MKIMFLVEKNVRYVLLMSHWCVLFISYQIMCTNNVNEHQKTNTSKHKQKVNYVYFAGMFVRLHSFLFAMCGCTISNLNVMNFSKEDGMLRTMNAEKLLKTIPTLQNQLDALLEFDCSANDLTNGIINMCFMLLFRDLIRLFACYNDGIINLLGKVRSRACCCTEYILRIF